MSIYPVSRWSTPQGPQPTCPFRTMSGSSPRPFFFQTGQQRSGGSHSPGAGSEIAPTTEGSTVSAPPDCAHSSVEGTQEKWDPSKP